ncbi:MAG: MogA/MoaB family molybdenum cofactor biosynthesis protein [Planctomycetaceae bacterium]|jgi:molybdopterin adenylyltransferase|nr:MogA/MoaB family molybdenum cofactor biosynthesis protein [Planctomycetaceae bacterium]MBT4012248.1 MogA/MoaB family molybdenum cofactor biosynthesis protein [Planctomycetaceae bacterium]MBT4723987.1 MogA/MoaB family molybdenum cofactor biosynthesis protein [Planctomycetaceae bacterium]MBT4846256.1 MogA/MoaB family molybdenum cofactor biosynthesis protein [Planctomycetaceae bacterium]MBT5126561.1 MogA/MoaB family molybdenum cofactor biosynthesis protein [Planctomycetaceae bacterium]
MVDSVADHRAQAGQRCGCCVITVSDTRTMETDGGGKLVVERLTAAGHKVFRREIIPDNPEPMIALLRACESDANIQAVLLTGGTGIANRDQTFETVSGLLSKIIPGYGELFRSLSYAEIGSATILSRTVGGLMSQTVVLTMPGSPAAVALAMDKIILPEIGHLVHEANK